jgi:hypothetical protein
MTATRLLWSFPRQRLEGEVSRDTAPGGGGPAEQQGRRAEHLSRPARGHGGPRAAVGSFRPRMGGMPQRLHFYTAQLALPGCWKRTTCRTRTNPARAA